MTREEMIKLANECGASTFLPEIPENGSASIEFVAIAQLESYTRAIQKADRERCIQACEKVGSKRIETVTSKCIAAIRALED